MMAEVTEGVKIEQLIGLLDDTVQAIGVIDKHGHILGIIKPTCQHESDE